VSFLTPVWNYVDALVHPTARQDALTAARHRAFIAPRLLGSFVALASFPIYIVIRGIPGALEVGVFTWLVEPILIVTYLSRTGRYDTAHILSSLSLTVLAGTLALFTGGIGSFAAIWLVVVPLEAALSASRRVIVLASIFTLTAASILLALGFSGLLPAPLASGGTHTLAALGIISAALYATGLALGTESLTRTSFWMLHAEEDRYRLLARNMTDVIVRHGRNGAVLFVSPAAEALLGVPVNQLLRNGLFDRVHVADRPAYLAALADAATLNEERSLEFRIRSEPDAHHAGRFIWAEMRCRPLHYAANEDKPAEREVVAVLRDVSERKAQEETIDAARAESERASAAKSRFIATMSHELRTPLNAIIGFSDMLTNETIELDAARRLDYARLVNESGRHLLAVVNGILDVSKMETGNFEITREPFAPATAIEGCTDLLALKARECGIELRLRLAHGLPDVAADRRAFNQILINLISNAIKFTPRGGHVTVSALCDGPHFAVTVEDNGVGIGEADLPRLGEAFFQADTSYDRRQDGSGLGLSIVKGLVGLHGGDVDIRSRLGEGTRVTVRLPIAGDCPRAAHPIKLVAERNAKELREIPVVANYQVKKSA
jgi:cell cycle sensor histidine kinase DivJ